MNDSPASILFNENGHPIGVVQDGYTYRLQVESKIIPQEDSFLASDKSILGSAVVANRISQISSSFAGELTDIFNNDVTLHTSGSSTIIGLNGILTLSSGTDTTSDAAIFTNSTIKYYPGREIYAQFTAGFTIPTDANSEQRAGIFDGYNGFFIGYHGIIFGITIRNLSSDLFIPISSFNGDLLDGTTNSNFTRNNSPEIINFAFENVYRIRFGWLGAAPIIFQVMAPDGQWVTCHTVRQPNTSAIPSIADPNLPITFEIIKSNSDTTDIKLFTNSWDGGIVDSPASPFKVFPTFSLLNSTTTLLDGYGVFIGNGEDVSGYVSIDITILSDQISSKEGLLLEWSQDGTIFAYPEKFTIFPNIGAFYSFAPRAKYFRVSYTNGPTDQSTFSLTTVYYPINRSTYVQNLDTDVSGQKATEVVRSVLAAQKSGDQFNNYTNLQATNNGILKVISAISDDINGTAAVKPSNTVATSTDPALVVAISPNTPITVMDPRPGTNITNSVGASISNIILLPSNSMRLGATIYNDSSGLLYVKLGSVASVTDFTIKLFPLGYYEVPFNYVGNIAGIWNLSNGFARVGELIP